ncbi:predicted protein [Botrytis cinerea T4]|uniref:Uncharacterized protein n=1 Tax=Botryotinia fuckeliana (strain T4) TaxID=999810 RepID=G2XQJ5_BOTF4|nr:predicted protein [Botrytis cinerea T4]
MANPTHSLGEMTTPLVRVFYFGWQTNGSQAAKERCSLFLAKETEPAFESAVFFFRACELSNRDNPIL